MWRAKIAFFNKRVWPNLFQQLILCYQLTLALKECDEDVGGFRRERHTFRVPKQQTGARVN